MYFDFSQNYFEVFQLATDYVIDRAALSDNYQQLQSQYHPDRFVNNSEQDKRLAMQITSYINEAHKILHDDQMRARYLLELAEVAFDAEKDTTQDMDFLLSQMALREAIDEVDKDPDPLTALDDFIIKAAEQKKQLCATFQCSYANQEWAQAKEAVLKLQFFKRLQHQISSKQEALEDELL